MSISNGGDDRQERLGQEAEVALYRVWHEHCAVAATPVTHGQAQLARLGEILHGMRPHRGELLELFQKVHVEVAYANTRCPSLCVCSLEGIPRVDPGGLLIYSRLAMVRLGSLLATAQQDTWKRLTRAQISLTQVHGRVVPYSSC